MGRSESYTNVQQISPKAKVRETEHGGLLNMVNMLWNIKSPSFTLFLFNVKNGKGKKVVRKNSIGMHCLSCH